MVHSYTTHMDLAGLMCLLTQLPKIEARHAHYLDASDSSWKLSDAVGLSDEERQEAEVMRHYYQLAGVATFSLQQQMARGALIENRAWFEKAQAEGTITYYNAADVELWTDWQDKCRATSLYKLGLMLPELWNRSWGYTAAYKKLSTIKPLLKLEVEKVRRGEPSELYDVFGPPPQPQQLERYLESFFEGCSSSSTATSPRRELQKVLKNVSKLTDTLQGALPRLAEHVTKNEQEEAVEQLKKCIQCLQCEANGSAVDGVVPLLDDCDTSTSYDEESATQQLPPVRTMKKRVFWVEGPLGSEKKRLWYHTMRLPSAA